MTAATPIEPQNDADCRGGEEALEIEVGKYAVMAEFLLALAEVEKPVERGSASRGFLDKVESKIASNLMQQVRLIVRLPARSERQILTSRKKPGGYRSYIVSSSLRSSPRYGGSRARLADPHA